MTKDNEKYQAYVQILNEELIPAMGCTEPIALAYAAAKAREVLGCLPDRVCIGASGSIIKNVKSVIVPNTNHLKGIPCYNQFKAYILQFRQQKLFFLSIIVSMDSMLLHHFHAHSTLKDSGYGVGSFLLFSCTNHTNRRSL